MSADDRTKDTFLPPVRAKEQDWSIWTRQREAVAATVLLSHMHVNHIYFGYSNKESLQSLSSPPVTHNISHKHLHRCSGLNHCNESQTIVSVLIWQIFFSMSFKSCSAEEAITAYSWLWRPLYCSHSPPWTLSHPLVMRRCSLHLWVHVSWQTSCQAVADSLLIVFRASGPTREPEVLSWMFLSCRHDE